MGDTDTDIFAPGFRAAPWWWEAAEPAPVTDVPLPQRVDVCIIGAGYAGLNCALELARAGTGCVVIDQDRIGHAASSRNGGLITGGLKIATSPQAERLPAEERERLVSEAVGTFRFLCDLIGREGIDCDLARVGRYTCAWSKGHYDKLAAGVETVARLTGQPAYMVAPEDQRQEIGSDHYRGGQVAEGAGTLHPAKYLRGLAQAAERAGAVLVPGCKMLAMRREGGDWLVSTSKGPVRAARVMLATNAYTGPEAPWFRRRLVPVTSFMIATEEISPDLARELVPNARSLADTRRVLSYFRLSPDHRRVLWGGRVGTHDMDPRESARRLHRAMLRVWPQLRGTRVTHSWNGNVAFTFDFLPHLGQHEGVHYALGCQGNGVAMQSWMGHQVARAMLAGGPSESMFAHFPFPARPLYSGDPWMLPAVLGWYRLRDWLDRNI